MTADQRDTPASAPLTFEAALARLESIVQQLEEGEIDLAEGLARYEDGVKLLKHCYHQLENAERRIELLNRVDADGRPDTEPFDDEAISLEEKSRARTRRRSRAAPADPPPSEDEIDGTARLF